MPTAGAALLPSDESCEPGRLMLHEPALLVRTARDPAASITRTPLPFGLSSKADAAVNWTAPPGVPMAIVSCPLESSVVETNIVP